VHLLRRTLENSLYFAILWQRWDVDEHWPVVRDNYFAMMPALLRKTIPGFLRKSVRKQLQGHGIGRRAPDEIYAEADADIGAVESVLGDGDFIFGEPSSIDAAAYALLGSILAAPLEDRLKKSVEDRPSLVEYCRRMKDRYY
jgi:glutathione S-transferase